MIVKLEGRTIEYKPGFGLDHHSSPLMAEIPGDYSHIHRSIDQLRSMNERGVLQLGPMSTTDIRASLMHDYKPFNISDLRNHGIDRLEYNKLANGIDLVGRGGNDVNSSNNNNNNNNNSNGRNNVDIGRHEQHQSHQQDQKAYSSPSTPPTPLSNNDGQMTETKVNIDLGSFFFFCLFPKLVIIDF